MTLTLDPRTAMIDAYHRARALGYTLGQKDGRLVLIPLLNPDVEQAKENTAEFMTGEKK